MEIHRIHLLTNNMLFNPQRDAVELLKQLLEEDIVLTVGEDGTIPSGCDILVAGRPERRHIAAFPHLKALVIPYAGIAEDVRLFMQDFPSVALYNLHYNAELVSEMAMALLFSAARFIVPMDRALRSNDWRLRYAEPSCMLLHEKTVMILGFGAIGQNIGRACHALGMNVMGIRRHPERRAALDYPVEIFPLQSMESLLPLTHALVIALPGTLETEGLIGEKQIRLLPAGAVLVNVGRGVIVDQEALYHALKDGHLRAAGVDVWYNYPESVESRLNTPPADFPFHELDNIVMSPHRASFTTDSERVRMQHLATLLNALVSKGEAPSRVDLELGY